MDTINELTTATLELTFYDETGTAAPPDSGSFELYDKFSGTVIRSGSLPAITATYNFSLTTTDNTFLDQTNRYEIRVLEVAFIYGTKIGRGVYEYQINNLSYLE